MVEPLRHRQTKEAATDMFYLPPQRNADARDADDADADLSHAFRADRQRPVRSHALQDRLPVPRRPESAADHLGVDHGHDGREETEAAARGIALMVDIESKIHGSTIVLRKREDPELTRASVVRVRA